MEDNIQTIARWLRRANTFVALVVGAILLAACGFILLDVTLRKFNIILGGSDEISGYVMAAIASWGLSFSLTELAHVRIDVIRVRLNQFWQVFLDLVSILIVFLVVTVVAFQAWPVLQKTIANGALSNTPLLTPLWIPQFIWFSGWVWFSVSAGILSVLSCILLGRRQYQIASIISGIGSEIDEGQS